MNEKITWHIEKKKLCDLVLNPRNPRRLTEKGMKDLVMSIDKFGLCEPIVLNLGNRVIGGHARIAGLHKNKEIEADCYVPSRLLAPDEERELNRRLNRNVAGEWDWDILSSDDTPEELVQWGFDLSELDIEEKSSKVEQDEKKKTICPQCGYEFS